MKMIDSIRIVDRSVVLSWLAAGLLAWAGAAQAASYTWDGGPSSANDNFSTAANWSGSNPANLTANSFVFGALASGGFATANVDLTGNLGPFTFDAALAAPMTIRGEALQFGVATPGTVILNNSTSLQTINNVCRAFNNVTFSAAAGDLLLGGATLDLRNDIIGATAIALTLDGNNSGTVSGPITVSSGTATQYSVLKQGSGTWALLGANGHAGGTNIKNGALRLGGGDNRLLSTSTVRLGDPATSGKLILGDASGAVNQTLAGLTTTGLGGSVVGGNAGVSTLTLNYAGIFSGSLGGGGVNENNLALIKSGSGTLTLLGSNTYIGATTIDGGELKVAAMNSFTIPNSNFSTPTVANGQITWTPGAASWTFTGGGVANGTTAYGNPGAWTANSAAGTQYLLFQGSGSIQQTLSFPASADYTLTFGAAGRSGHPLGTVQVQLDGVNQGEAITPVANAWNEYTVTLTGVTAGNHTVAFVFTPNGDSTSFVDYIRMSYPGPGGSLSPVSAVNLTASGATLNLAGGTLTIGSLSGVAGSIVTNGSLVAGGNDGTTGFAGVFSGSSLTKTGAGTLTLSGVNPHPGATTISNGTLQALVGGSCSNSAVSVAPASGVATLTVSVTDNTKQWTCASLATEGAGAPHLTFDFAVTPGALAPLEVTGTATFTTMPAVTVNTAVILNPADYPLLHWASGGANPPTTATLTGAMSASADLVLAGTTLSLRIASPGKPVIEGGAASVPVTLDEDGSPTAFSLTLNAVDPNGSSADLAWSISTPAAHGTATATGTGASKAIGYAPVTDYNGPDSFVVTVTDGESLTDTIMVNVTITPVNDAPAVSGSPSVTMNEDVNRPFAASDFNFTDTDAGDTLNKIQVTQLETKGALEYDTTGVGGWADVTLNQEISAADIAASRLRFKPVANAYGTSYATFQFKVSDGTAYSAAAATMTVNVTQLVDDSPVVMVAAEATVNQTAVGVVKARSDGGPVFSISGGEDAGLFGIANVANTGVLSFLAAPTVPGAKYYVEVTVTDPGGSAKILIEVTAVSGSTSGTIFTFR